MPRAWSKTRCTRCHHEEVRYSNVKRCRACGGPLERPGADRDVLLRQIVDRARLWAAHDPILAELLREWENA